MMVDYQNGQLYCEAVPLAALAADVGTPAYIYSRRLLRENAAAFRQSMLGEGLVCYAVKANGNREILRLFAAQGLGADVTSGGELFLAAAAGFPPQKILFSGVGKTNNEIEMALQMGIKALHVESAAELKMIAAVAEKIGRPAPIALRVNPDIAADTHPAISTAKKADKFGIPAEQVLTLLREGKRHSYLLPLGLAIHLGSQITTLRPYQDAVAILLELAAEARSLGIQLEYLDAGGGLGIAYQPGTLPSITEWITVVAHPLARAGYQAVVEPGRSIVGPAGCLLTSVTLCKNQGSKQFVVVDAGMHTLIRPALYDAYHPVLPVTAAELVMRADVVGPVCESGDWLARDRRLPKLRAGDLLALTHAGAYGFAMSSNYNGRLRPVEILVDGEQYRIIRPRQTFADLLY